MYAIEVDSYNFLSLKKGARKHNFKIKQKRSSENCDQEGCKIKLKVIENNSSFSWR